MSFTILASHFAFSKILFQPPDLTLSSHHVHTAAPAALPSSKSMVTPWQCRDTFPLQVLHGNLLPNQGFKKALGAGMFSTCSQHQADSLTLFLLGFLQGYQTMLSLSRRTQVTIEAPFCHTGGLASLLALHITSEFRCLKPAADIQNKCRHITIF